MTHSRVHTIDSRRLRASAYALAPIVLLLLLGAILAAGCGGGRASGLPAATGSPAASPTPVARVDGKVILRSEVEETIAASRLTGKPLTYAKALDAMVRRRLVEAEAARLGVTVADSELQSRLDQVVQSAGGEKALEAALKKVGLTVAAYREQLRAALLAEHLADAKFPGKVAGVAQAKAFYQRHRVQFTTPATVDLGDISVKTKRFAQAVKQRLRLGYSFAETARQYTGDPQGKASGGRLGWIQVASLPPDLAKAVAELKVGQVSRAARAMDGWHVLKLYGRRPASVPPFATLRAAIVQELTRRARAEALARWIAAARHKSDVVTLP